MEKFSQLKSLFLFAVFCALAACESDSERQTEEMARITSENPESVQDESTQIDSTAKATPEQPRGWQVVFYTSRRPVDSCPISRLLQDAFLDFSNEIVLDGVDFVDWSARPPGIEPDLPTSYNGPQVVVLKDGVAVDRHVGIQHPQSRISLKYTAKEFNRGAFMSLLARNGLMEGELESWLYETGFDVGMSFDKQAVGPYDFRGADLRESTFVEAKLSGTSFKGSNLSHTDFTGAEFFGVNLQGANMEGADLENTFWRKSICPDGSLSEERDSKSCVGTTLIPGEVGGIEP